MGEIKALREEQIKCGTKGIPVTGNAEATILEVSGSNSETCEALKTLNDLGIAYHTQCEIELAIQKYQEALSINPDFADAQNNLAAAYYHQGDIDSAIKQWEQAVRVDTGLVQTHHNLGIAYGRQGRLELATEAWDGALHINPDDADAYFGLGEIYEVRGEPVTALTNYQRFVDLAPSWDDFYVIVSKERIQLLREKMRTETGDNRKIPSTNGVGLPLLLA